MPQTGLRGPYQLITTGVEANVIYASPGAYALGTTANNTFNVAYVGRADDDVAKRLKNWVGNRKYSHFKFEYYNSPKEAFEKECHLYHDFSPGLDNEIHPDRPNGTTLLCPVCPSASLLGFGRRY